VRRRVAWPGVAVKSAKGKLYHYWTRTTPWTPLPNPIDEPDRFMRELAQLQRLELRTKNASAGTLANTIRLYRKSPAFTDRSANTQKVYGLYLDRLQEIFPDAVMREITRQLVQRYVMDEHADTRGAANMMLKVLKALFKWAEGRDNGLPDPTKKIEPYDSEEHEPWPEGLLELALASGDVRFRAAVALHYYTGQRTGDVCGMTWNALTPDRQIPVKQQKTGTPLLIPVLPVLSDVLDELPRTALTILTNREGGPLKPDAFRRWVTAFGKDHGKHLVPHGLRKNAVIALLEARCSIAEVSAVTGQSLQMVEHYAKQRNQPRIASAAMLKWGAAQTANGKTFPNIENRSSKVLK
jgi:integrase